MPTFAPAGCGVGYELRYTNNGVSATVPAFGPPMVTLAFPVGYTPLLWTLVVPGTGQAISECTKNITVLDNIPPIITCPADISRSQVFDQPCPSHQVDYDVSWTDNCPTSGDPTLTDGLPSGSPFPNGTTTNCFEVTDTAGNRADCCFDITYASTWPENVPEPCDGIDNNCNDAIDEGYSSLGLQCVTGFAGQCQVGHNLCNQAGDGVSCVPDVLPSESTTESECLEPGGQVFWGMMIVDGALKGFRCVVEFRGAVPECELGLDGRLAIYPPMCL